jgi:RIO-like serine/threonine protein kinase
VVERLTLAQRRPSVNLEIDSLQMSMQFYEIGKKIGSGSSAIVYAAIYIPLSRYQ